MKRHHWILLAALLGSIAAAMAGQGVADRLQNGAVAVAGTSAVLRVLTQFTDVSVFAMNITTALGFALAVNPSAVAQFVEAARNPAEGAIPLSGWALPVLGLHGFRPTRLPMRPT